MLVQAIMTREVITVHADDRVVAIAKLLVDHHIKGVPVVDDAKTVIGIITDADLILQNARLHLPTFINILDGVIAIGEHRAEEELRRIYGVRARDIMSQPVVSVTSSTDIGELATLMWEKKINPVPVVDEGVLVGIVSRMDFVRLLLSSSDTNR